MTDFGKAWRAAYPALHGAFGEAFVLRPRRASADTRAGDGPDPARPPITVTGIYMDTSERFQAPDAHDQRTDKRPGMTGGGPVIEVFPALTGAADIRRGDRIERVSDGCVWRVVECLVDDEGVVSAHVARLG